MPDWASHGKVPFTQTDRFGQDTHPVATGKIKSAEMQPLEAEHAWWQRGIIYQIYPRSFMDSNGDGTGDLPGITARLDYLVRLGVDAIWISPIFPSPMADFGYDVANYTDVDPLFGTLDDLDQLVEAAHQRGMRVLLDY